MRKVILVLVVASAGGLTQEPPPGEANSRDLSDLFYSDTLAPAKKPAAAPVRKKQTAAAKAVAPEHREVASSSPPSGLIRRIGLKYRILLHDAQCDIHEVDPARIFYSGEQIRLQIEPNVDGYLYVLQKGSSGHDSTLFPHPEINGGDNRVERGILYSVPATQWFTFNDVPGDEHLTLIASRAPLESVPRRTPERSPEPVSIIAVNNELARTVQRRDLVLFTERAPVVGSAARGTQSTVVVNSNADHNDAVYLEIVLKHR
jgi:hypothetical protein